MATEQPQTLPAGQKLAPAASDEQVLDDKSSTEAVNGHSKLDEDVAQSDERPAMDAKDKSQEPTPATADDLANQKAFAANNTLLDANPSKSVPDPSLATDTDMPDANEASAADGESTSAMDVDKVNGTDAPETEKETEKGSEEQAGEATEEAATTDQGPEAQDPKPDTPVLEPTPDPMDVETAADGTNVGSTVTQTSNAGDSAAIKDAPVATSSQDSAQPSTELSKLDIGATQPDVAKNQTDTPMADQPTSATKVSREREEDDGDERVAKRVKTEDSMKEAPADSSIVAHDAQSAPAPNEPTTDDIDSQAITAHHNKQIRAYLAGLKKTKIGLNFRSSVEKLWPGLWEEYRKKVPNPVDISVFEAKLRQDGYANYGELKADVILLYENSVLFNGESNQVTDSARSVRDAVLSKLPEIYRLEEAPKLEKGKAHPTRHTEPRAATQARRQSQVQAPVRAPATSPKPKATPTAPAAQQATPPSAAPAFAIQPNGMPQIRRDSTREGGDRPKRPIHPPKNRDLDYASANRKKLEPEQRFNEIVLEEVKKGKYYNLNQWFLTPVDPVALNIPTYFSIVKKPMDLETMTRKNREGEYKSVKDLEKDMKLIVHNAALFNGEHHEVTHLAKGVEEIFKAEVAKRDQWMKRHYPPEALPAPNLPPPSPERSAHESEEESDVDGDNEGSEAVRNLQNRLDEEQDKLNTLLGSKKPDLTMMEIQQSMVTMLQRKLAEEKNKANEKKPKPKKKGGSKSKTKSGGGSAAATGSKKSAVGNATTSKKGSHSTSHKKATPKSRPVGQLEKAVITEGINELDGGTLRKAVEIIKKDTGQNENDDGEMELDIEALSMDALRRLYELIHKQNPSIRSTLEKKPEYSNLAAAEPKPKPSAPSKAKKNKPMNKHEQERKIEQLRELKAQLQRHGSGSQEPLPELEANQPAESSESESDSEEE
ncbi:Bromodomain-containing protein [Hypoxylon sp. FL1284]|nr:Bromodomain-containing protein [Hypoxylon sp. FL1284]